MADNNAQVITPARAGFGRSRDIVPGDSGTPVSALKRIAATTDSKAGLTLREIVTRMYALGLPLWSDKWGVVDLSFEVRNPMEDGKRSAVRGTLHVCDHTANKGSKQKCKGHARGESCDFEFISEGDSVTRWRMSVGAYTNLPPQISSQATALNNARSTLKRRVEVLQGKFSKEDILITPSVKQAVDFGLLDAESVGGKKSAPAPKAATTKKVVTRNKKPATRTAAAKTS